MTRTLAAALIATAALAGAAEANQANSAYKSVQKAWEEARANKPGYELPPMIARMVGRDAGTSAVAQDAQDVRPATAQDAAPAAVAEPRAGN